MKSTQTYFFIGLLGLLLSCNLVVGQVKFDLEEDFNELYKIDYWNTKTHDFSNAVLSMLQSSVFEICLKRTVLEVQVKNIM